MLQAADARVLAVLIVGVLGGLLLCLAELSTVIEIRVGAVVQATYSGSDRHSWALLVLGAAAIPLAWGAAVGRSRPAAIALAAIGAVALLLWGVRDLPDVDETGVFGIRYEDASAGAGGGFWLELIGGIALLVAAAGALAAGRPRR